MLYVLIIMENQDFERQNNEHNYKILLINTETMDSFHDKRNIIDTITITEIQVCIIR